MTRIETVSMASGNKNPAIWALILIIFFAGMVFAPGEAAAQSLNCGDANHDYIVNIGDIVYLVAFIFKGGPPPEPLCVGDVNGDGEVNLGDGVYLVAWIFKGGPAPACKAGGELTDRSACKSSWKDAAADTIPPDQSCIEYNFDGEGFLSLKHYNAGFNCCPGEITVDVSLEGNILTLTESEEMAECDCSCLFDLDIGVYFLEPGQYTIRVVEPYLPPGGEVLEFEIDLTTTPSGIYCVSRNGYPWGTGPEPSGEVTGRSTCKSMIKDAAADTTPPDQDCITWQYDGSNTLTLKHINAGFNCCPTELLADFTFEGNKIIITEDENLDNGGCLCLCLFDVDYEIEGILPGEYVIRVNGMYLKGENQEIQFTVDLTESPSGTFCVTREYYPWGY